MVRTTGTLGQRVELLKLGSTGPTTTLHASQLAPYLGAYQEPDAVGDGDQGDVEVEPA